MSVTLQFFSKLPKWLKIILGIILLGAIAFKIFGNRFSQSPLTDEYIVRRGDISETIIISGNANSSSNASVYSPSTGIVEEMYVKNGEIVVPGQILMKVKSTAMEIDRANALAAYQAAQSELNSLRQAKITNQSLLESGRKSVIDTSVSLQQMTNRRNEGLSNPATGKPYTQDEIDSINSSYTSAKSLFSSTEKKYLDSDSAINAGQSAMTAAWLSYQATLNGIIKSPIGGKIINLAVGSGDYVYAKVTGSASTAVIDPVLRISTIDALSILVKLNEIDVSKVQPGQDATVVFDSIPEKTFTATLNRVDEVGVNINAVVTYNAYLTLNESDERIRPSMTATVTIQTDGKKQVLLAPNTSLQKENTAITVLAKNGNSSVRKPVSIGLKNSEVSEITSGLQEGDVIFIPKAK